MWPIITAREWAQRHSASTSGSDEASEVVYSASDHLPGNHTRTSWAQNIFWRWQLVVACLISSVANTEGKVFSLAGGAVDLQEVTPTVQVFYQALRLNRANNQWNFELVLRNTALAPLTGSVVVLVDSFQNTAGPINPDGRDDQGKAYYDLSAQIPSRGLLTSQASVARTLALGVSSGPPQITWRVYAGAAVSGPPLAFVRTLNEFGQPLPSVTVVEIGPDGQSTNRTDALFGVATLGMGVGSNWFAFSAAGCLPVWRSQTLIAGSVIEIPSPRMARRGTNSLTIGSLGAVLSNAIGNLQLTLPAGAFASATTVTLTPLTAQTLPSLLPTGWSPLQAFWLELSSEPAVLLPCRFDLWGPVRRNETAALAHWNASALRWEVQSVVTGLGAATVNLLLAGSGGWALVVGDAGSLGPAAPQSGQPLAAVNEVTPDYTQLAVSSSVTPGTSTPSRVPELVTATAALVISNTAGTLSSGTLLRARVEETYQMRDGSLRVTPAFETWLVGYQRPGGTNASLMQADFPLRPLLLLGGDDLAQGIVNADILPPGSFAGAVLTADGGGATNGTVRLSAAAGMVNSPQALQLSDTGISNFVSLATGDLSLITTFQLTIGELGTATSLGLQVTNAPTNSLFVLARILSEAGVYGLQPVLRMASDLSGSLSSLEPDSAPKLPGLRAAGQYVLARVPTPLSLVTGLARNTLGNPVSGLVVRSGPWSALTASDGTYQLLASPGSATITLTDPTTGDTGGGTVIVQANQVARADLSAGSNEPRVVSVAPLNGATNVPLVATITVVFNQAINPGTTVNNAIQLLGPGTNLVPASLSLNLRNDQATLLPLNPLTAQSVYNIVLSTNLANVGGQRLAGPPRFSFTTASLAFSRDPSAQLITFEPTNGLMHLRGTAGFAQPGQPVLLVNETSGRTATVLSDADGSFHGSLAAVEDDQVSVTVVNSNGTRDRIAPNREVYGDGSIGLFSGGGTLTSQGPYGNVQLDVDAGSIVGKSKLYVEAINTNQLPANVRQAPLLSGPMYGGIHLKSDANAPNQALHVSFPIPLEALGLPVGIDPTNVTFGLVIPREFTDENGQTQVAYQLIDRMLYEHGMLVTHSFPFLGLLVGIELGYELIAIPCLYAMGSSMLVFGSVYAAPEIAPGVASTDVTRRTYLPGAVVTASLPMPGFQPSPLQLRPGTVYAAASSDKAKYTIMAPVSPLSTTALRASHPKLQGRFALKAIPNIGANERLLLNNTLDQDLGVPIPAYLFGSDSEPPLISVGHTPQLPGFGTNALAELRVVASDNASTPTITVTIQDAVSLNPNTNVAPSSIGLTLITNDIVGPYASRCIYSTASPLPARVQYHIHAVDGSGNASDAAYVVLFGGTEPVAVNPIPAPDPNDRTPLTIISSDPPSGSKSIAPGAMLTFRFNKPIDRAFLQDSNAIQIYPAGPQWAPRLSDSQLELQLALSGLVPGNDYVLTLTSGIKDLLGNRLDGDLRLPGAQGYTYPFTAGALPQQILSGVVMGGGSIVRGIYAYVLERASSPPTAQPGVKVLDLSDPSNPHQVGHYDLPLGYPRDLVLIPQYSFQRSNQLALASNGVRHFDPAPTETMDLLAVVGGTAGGDNPQYLRLLDLSNPTNLQLVAGVALTADPSVLVTRVQWSPPLLGYLQMGTVSSIGLVDIQTLISAFTLTPDQIPKLPTDGVPGVDLNGDGDYVDSGESLPVPPKRPTEFAGKVGGLALNDTDQLITDFAMRDRGSFVGVTLDPGNLLGTNGLPMLGTNGLPNYPVPGAYQTLFADGVYLERGAATYAFTNAHPKRLLLIKEQPFQNHGQIELKDLALVTVHMDIGYEQGHTNRLEVLDITVPINPLLLAEIYLPSTNGDNVYGLELRDDGLLALAASRDLLLLDPAHLQDPQPAGGTLHPAIIGVIPGAGEGMRTFGSASAGVTVTAFLDKNVVLRTPPLLQFVSYTGTNLLAPASLSGLNQTNLVATLAQLSPVDALRLARYQAIGALVNSSLSPPNPRSQYHVLVRAMGSAGSQIALSLEALNGAGRPLMGRGPLFPPVRAVSADTEATLTATPATVAPLPRALAAWRLSDDPTSPYYNLYLSRPFALVYEELSNADRQALQAAYDRDILWSGAFMRAAIDPSMRLNPVLGPYVATIDFFENVLKPGASVIAQAFSGDYLMGPNPMPLQGGVAVPAALGTLGAHNGEVMFNEVDMFLPGRRLPLEFRRVSFGQGLFEGAFGRGWDFNFNQRLVELKESVFEPGQVIPLVVRGTPAESELANSKDLLFFNGACRTMVFRFAGTNAPPEIANDPLAAQLNWLADADRYYLPPDGQFDILAKMKDGRFCRLTSEGMQYWYDTIGRLQVVYDRFPTNAIELAYNERGDLIRIYDEMQRSLSLGYYRLDNDSLFDASVDIRTSQLLVAGKICRLKDYTGRDVLFEYNNDGMLARKRGPQVTVAGTGGFIGRQEVDYLATDGLDLSKSAKAFHGVVSGSPSGTPLLAANEIGQTGRDVTTKMSVAGQNVGLQLNFTNSAAALSSGEPAAAVTSQDGSQAAYKFDRFGRPTSITLSGTNAPPEYSQFFYNRYGLVTNVVYPEGNSEEYTYDENNPVLRSRKNILQIVKKPGPRGGTNLTATATFDPMYNEPTLKTDFNGVASIITLAPDKTGPHYVSIQGDQEEYQRNEFGQLRYYKTADGIEHTFAYQADGFLYTQSVSTQTTTYYYEGPAGQRGLATRIVDPNNVETHRVYDERNQLVSEDKAGLVTENAYDDRGFPVFIRQTVDTGLTKLLENQYDQLGFVRTQILHDVEVDGVLTNLVTTYEPDAAGRLHRVVFPSGETHLADYDHAGRMTSYRVGNYVEQYSYDRNGNLTTNQIGNAFEAYLYDGHDRITRILTPVGGIVDYVRDGNNNLISHKVTDPQDGVILETVYIPDYRNRVKRIERTGDTTNSVVRYDYNLAARTVTMTDANNQQCVSAFDAMGRLSLQTFPTRQIQFFYDGNNNLFHKVSLEGAFQFEDRFDFNSRNQITNIIDTLGHSTSLALGLDGRVLNLRDRDGHITTNTFSVLGEKTGIFKPNGVLVTLGHSGNRETSYARDARGKGVKHSFDSSGRLQTTEQPDGAITTYSNYDGRNAPQTITYASGATVTSIHNAEGRVVSRHIDDGAGGTSDETYDYDVLGRVRKVTDPSGSISFTYSKLGYARLITYAQSGLTLPLQQEADGAGFRTAVIYPSGLLVTTPRDPAGRLAKILPDSLPTVVSSTTYAADNLVGERFLGPGLLREQRQYDALRRPLAIRYERNSDGRILLDLRYFYTPGGAESACQSLDRAGRADFYAYDAGYRIIRSDRAVRPALSAEQSRTMTNFALPAGLGGAWSPGAYASVFAYTNTDTLQAVQWLNPDNLPVPPFAANYDPPDDLLHIPAIDGIARSRDPAGNVTSGRIWVRVPGSANPTPILATFHYSPMGQLTRVDRADGVIVTNQYNAAGLRIRRSVTGDASRCQPSDWSFVYEGANLIEIRDLADTARLLARFYYGEQGDELLAADFWNAGLSQFERYYYLTDVQRSVVGLADAQGRVIERIRYDTWGQPLFEAADEAGPQVATIQRDGNSILIRFSEPVLPKPVSDGGSTNLISDLLSLTNVFEMLNSGIAVAGQFQFEESIVPFGTTYRFTPAGTWDAAWQLHIRPDTLHDDWSNTNAEELISLNLVLPAGALLYSASVTNTGPTLLGRSQLNSPFLFQSQFFDYDTGLVYCRARFYDPSCGLFLQPDPAGFEDSVNRYAAFANNPANFRDPTGTATDELGRRLVAIGSEASLPKDGITGVLVGSAIEFVGAVLELGTGAAEGWEKLQNARPGCMGRLDVVQGAELIANDVQVATATISIGTMGSSISRSAVRTLGKATEEGYGRLRSLTLNRKVRAYAYSGWENAQDIIAQKLMVRSGVEVLESHGITRSEASGIHSALLAARSEGRELVLSIRSKPLDSVAQSVKNKYRRYYVEKGLMQKRAIDYQAKSTARATLKSPVDGRVVVSDLDIWTLEVDGKLASTQDYTLFESRANRAYAERVKSSRTPNPPFQHHGQAQVAEGYGRTFLGHTLDYQKLGKIGHPGHAVTIRLDARGNLLAYRTPGWQIDADIRRVDLALQARRDELARLFPFPGLPPNWFMWQ